MDSTVLACRIEDPAGSSGKFERDERLLRRLAQKEAFERPDAVSGPAQLDLALEEA